MDSNTSFSITGNLSKVKVFYELSHIIEEATTIIRILDIGCGPSLDFWEPLLNSINSKNFELYGIDVNGIDKAAGVVTAKGWDNVKLMQLSGYSLEDNFEVGLFDIVTATQVLEHISKLDKFLTQVSRIIKPDGQIFFTLDSAHHSGIYNIRYPITCVKNIIKKILAMVGNEKHYDLPLYDYYVEQLFSLHDLKILNKQFYNIHPLKEIHNHKVAKHNQNEFLNRWMALEDLLNQEEEFISQNKNYFLGLYYHLQKA